MKAEDVIEQIVGHLTLKYSARFNLSIGRMECAGHVRSVMITCPAFVLSLYATARLITLRFADIRKKAGSHTELRCQHDPRIWKLQLERMLSGD